MYFDDRPSAISQSDFVSVDTSAEEARLDREIAELNQSIESMINKDPSAPAIKFLKVQLEKLEEQLEAVQDQTLF